MFPIAILAGGLGTRLGAISASRPKALVPICGRPFIDHQLALLRSAGLTRVVLCVSHLGKTLEAHVGDGNALGLDVTYSFDGPERLGTAGALTKALPQLAGPFFAIYGDSYLDCDYTDVQTAFLRSGKAGLMTVFENNNSLVPSNVLFRDGEIERYDKVRPTADMRHVDYGLSLFHPGAFANVALDRPTDLAHVFNALLRDKELAGFSVPTRFHEVGTPEGVEATEAYLKLRSRT